MGIVIAAGLIYALLNITKGRQVRAHVETFNSENAHRCRQIRYIPLQV